MLIVTLSLYARVFALEAGFGKARNADPNLDWVARSTFFQLGCGPEKRISFLFRSELIFKKPLHKNEYDDQGVS